ncbi:hypothetical protein UlMin_025742 [Ulmus minor]
MTLSKNKKSNSLRPKTQISSFFHPSSKTLHSSDSLQSPRNVSYPAPTFSQAMMEENIENAEAIITKWDLNSSSYKKVTALFRHDRKEAKEYIKSVKKLQLAMQYLLSENSTSSKLVLAQTLMQTAMVRLENEFYRKLSENRHQLDPESISSRSAGGSSKLDEDESEAELELVGKTITEVERVSALAMSDLKSIADCMISSGYGKECVKIYKIIRKSIVDEGLYRLRIVRFRSSQIHKMNWEALVGMIKNWLNAIKIALKTLLSGEKILCDRVFSASETIRESCFYEITKEGATSLFRFPELVAKCKKSPERIFQLMEMYEAFSDVWPEIESIFGSESNSGIRSQALSSLTKLGDSIYSILKEFESTTQKDSSKTLVLGGGTHPMTRSVMDYLSSLADYNGVLSAILAEYPPPQESFFETTASADGSTPAAASVYLAWLILVLLCKLDAKAELYKDVSLSYLFLANNLHFIVEKVRTTNLKLLLGDDWISKHTKKVHQYASNYETLAWTDVFSSLPENTMELSSEMVNESFRRFNAAFEEAYRKQTSWIVEDGKLRDSLKKSIAKNLVPKFREFYEANLAFLTGEKNLELLVRLSPDDLGNYLSDLFCGNSASGSSMSSSSWPSQLRLPRRNILRPPSPLTPWPLPAMSPKPKEPNMCS